DGISANLIRSCTRITGQTCYISTRILAPASRYDEVMDMVTAIIAAILRKSPGPCHDIRSHGQPVAVEICPRASEVCQSRRCAHHYRRPTSATERRTGRWAVYPANRTGRPHPRNARSKWCRYFYVNGKGKFRPGLMLTALSATVS